MDRIVAYALVTVTGFCFGWFLGEAIERWAREEQLPLPDDADMLGDFGPLRLVEN